MLVPIDRALLDPNLLGAGLGTNTTSRVGRDMIDAPRGISEDHANALCGALAKGRWIMD